MIELPDSIYQRSVIKQLYLKEESRHLFQKNAYSVSINKENPQTGYYAEASSLLTFRDEAVLKEGDLNGILRKLLCAGASLTELNAEIIFSGGFSEEILRKLSYSLKFVADRIGAKVRRASVFLKDGNEPEINILLLGRGPLKAMADAPWQIQQIFENQDIVLTGSLGRSGIMEIFHKNKEELKKVYPKLFIERLSRKTADRLPLIEIETAPFYKTTAVVPLEAGGLNAALRNLGDRERAGLIIYSDRLKYEQETIELCNHFNINPLELSSAGAYLLATDRGEELTYSLRKAGLEATSIGQVMGDKKRIVVFGDEERFIEPPKYNF